MDNKNVGSETSGKRVINGGKERPEVGKYVLEFLTHMSGSDSVPLCSTGP